MISECFKEYVVDFNVSKCDNLRLWASCPYSSSYSDVTHKLLSSESNVFHGHTHTLLVLLRSITESGCEDASEIKGNSNKESTVLNLIRFIAKI